MPWQTTAVVVLHAGDTIINPTGMFVYSGAPAFGNLIFSVANAAGTDGFGNAYQAGAVTYLTASVFTQMTAGQIQIQGAAGQNAPALLNAVSAGEIGLSSGKITAGDNPANVIVDSAQASGSGFPVISLQATQVQITNNLIVSGTGTSLGGSTSTGAGDNGGVTSGPSGTVNAFPAAGPNHTHAEIHHHPYHP